MKTISVYTTTTNAIEGEFTAVESIRSALGFADEVIVIDGGSIDSTLTNICLINDHRIRVFNNQWLHTIGTGMYPINKSLGMGRCTSEWCILMDSDEVFHESDYERIRTIPEHVGDNIVAVEFNTLHFYRDYYHLLNGCSEWKDLYTKKIYMVRNGLGIHHGSVGGDPDAHVMCDGSPIPRDRVLTANVSVFHYGHVRSREYYLKKTAQLHGHFNGKDIDYQKLDKEFKWVPWEKLSTFSGDHPKVMKERIAAGIESHTKITELYQWK